MDVRRAFVAVARAEGISTLALFFVAMPLKYGLGWEHATMVPGWLHGVLFVAYVGLLGLAGLSGRWPLLTLAVGFVAAFVPFGTFWFEGRLPAPRRDAAAVAD